MVTKAGLFLPMRLVYKGKTTSSLPKRVNFPDGFNVHRKPLEELALNTDQQFLRIFDVFKRQKMDKYKSVSDKYNIVSVYTPANMTNHFQPLDLAVNGVAKCH